MRAAARGLPLVIVNPSFVLGPDDPKGTSNELVTRFLQRRDPGLRRRRPQHRRRPRRRRRPPARRRARRRGRALHPRRPELHPAAAVRRPRRIADIPPPPMKLPGQLAGTAVAALERTGLPLCRSLGRGPAGASWWTYRNDKAKRELGFRPRPYEETLEDTVHWQLEHLDDAGAAERATDAAIRAGGVLAGLGRAAAAPRILADGGAGERRRRNPPTRAVGASSTAARPRPTTSAPAGRWSASCASSASSTAPSGSRSARRPPRDRRADQAAPRAGAGRRRRGDQRLKANQEWLEYSYEAERPSRRCFTICSDD